MATRFVGSPGFRRGMLIAVGALVLLLALSSPAIARADEYVMTVGWKYTHWFTGWDRDDTYTFRATGGLAYRVNVFDVEATNHTIGFAIFDETRTHSDAEQAFYGRPDYVYAWPATDQTMTVSVSGWFTSGPLTHYSIRLEAFQPWTVDGTAYDMTTGRALPGMRVELIHPTGGAPVTEQTTTTDANGRYSFRVPLPNDYHYVSQFMYRLRFSDPSGVLEGEYSGGSPDVKQAVQFPWVTGGRLTCDGHLGLPWTVASTVRDADSGAPIPGAAVCIYRGSNSSWWEGVTAYTADENGFVTFTEAAHTVDCIQIIDPSGAHPTQYLGGQFESFDSTLMQPRAGTTWSKDLTITVGQTVAGDVVVRSTGVALPGVTVEAWRNMRLYGWKLAASAVTDADGRYSMKVLAGPYRIRAAEPSGAYLEQWSGEARGRDVANDVVVAAGSPAECDFRLSTDKTPPVTTASAPAGWAKAPATVTLNPQDEGEGVKATFYRVRIDAPNRLYDGPIQLTTSGQQRVVFWSLDYMDNAELAKSVTVWVDADAPGLVTDAVPRYEGSATVRIAAEDAHSGVADVAYRVDGGEWTVEPGSIATAVVTAPGLHTLEYRSVDAVGNETAPAMVLFAIGSFQSGASCSISAPALVSYNTTASVMGTLALQLGDPAGMPVGLERSTDGVVFQSTGTTVTVSAGGRFIFDVPLTRSYYFRVRSVETSDVAEAVSAPVLVQVTASVSRPSAVSTTYWWRTIKVSGTLLPKHASGNRVIKIRCYRYEGGKWVWHKSVWATSRSGSTSSSYTAYLRLTRGSWRLYARHVDSSHALTDSAYRSVKVR